jgi:DNA polymerase
LGKEAEKLLGQLVERVSYLSELGVEFIPSPSSSRDSLYPALREKILNCQRCGLSRERIHAVPGEGNLEADLMFVGEAPGREEDIRGRPFVGKAGQLLTRIIQAMKFTREEVYITNVVKCRPPQNRTPRREEMEKCKPYLLQQIQMINPRVIVSLGKVATDFFVKSRMGMTSLRGQFYEFGPIRVMPTFHPSYIVRNEDNKKIKRMVWEDMKKVMDCLGKK